MTTIRLLLQWLANTIKAERIASKAQRGLRKDRGHVTPWLPCACCGGTATRLQFRPDACQYTCKDRRLCRQVMIMTSLLQSSHGEGS